MKENQRESVVAYQPEYVPGYEPPFFENILPSDQPGIQITHNGNKVVVTPIGDDLEVDQEVTVESSIQPDEETQLVEQKGTLNEQQKQLEQVLAGFTVQPTPLAVPTAVQASVKPRTAHHISKLAAQPASRQVTQPAVSKAVPAVQVLQRDPALDGGTPDVYTTEELKKFRDSGHTDDQIKQLGRRKLAQKYNGFPFLLPFVNFDCIFLPMDNGVSMSMSAIDDGSCQFKKTIPPSGTYMYNKCSSKMSLQNSGDRIQTNEIEGQELVQQLQRMRDKEVEGRDKKIIHGQTKELMDIQESTVEKKNIAPTTKDTLQFKYEMQKLMVVDAVRTRRQAKFQDQRAANQEPVPRGGVIARALKAHPSKKKVNQWEDLSDPEDMDTMDQQLQSQPQVVMQLQTEMMPPPGLPVPQVIQASTIDASQYLSSIENQAQLEEIMIAQDEQNG
uniref:Uncharacterized protein n=1 Tax=Romanomermis culicivorax TaxID=13658 RepID=A0A915K8C3_ROMCU